MPRKEDQRILNLARKNAAQIKPPKADDRAKFDPTLVARDQDESPETRRLFKEMKRREF